MPETRHGFERGLKEEEVELLGLASDSDLRDWERQREGHGIDLPVASNHVVVDEFLHDSLLQAFAMHQFEQLVVGFCFGDEGDEQEEGADEAEDDGGCLHDGNTAGAATTRSGQEKSWRMSGNSVRSEI